MHLQSKPLVTPSSYDCDHGPCKLVKHCIHSVCRFMEVGWPVLNVWLAEAKKTQDVAVLVEVMQVKI